MFYLPRWVSIAMVSVNLLSNQNIVNQRCQGPFGPLCQSAFSQSIGWDGQEILAINKIIRMVIEVTWVEHILLNLSLFSPQQEQCESSFCSSLNCIRTRIPIYLLLYVLIGESLIDLSIILCKYSQIQPNL